MASEETKTEQERRERGRECHREWQRKNRDKVSKYQRKWYETNSARYAKKKARELGL